MKILTMADRRKLEEMWNAEESTAAISEKLGICRSTVYAELRRGRTTDGAGGVALDRNYRPGYSAEIGQAAFMRSLRNRGCRPKAATGRSAPHE